MFSPTLSVEHNTSLLSSGALFLSQDDHFPKVFMFATSGISASQEWCALCTEHCVHRLWAVLIVASKN